MAPMGPAEPREKSVLTFDDVIESIDWLLADDDNSLTRDQLHKIRAFIVDKRTVLSWFKHPSAL